MITPEEIVRVLNEAVDLDPVAMYMVGCFTTPVNQELADHPSIQVGPMLNGQPGPYMLRFIGLINGFVAPHGKYIAEHWGEPDSESRRPFLGYLVVDSSAISHNV